MKLAKFAQIAARFLSLRDPSQPPRDLPAVLVLPGYRLAQDLWEDTLASIGYVPLAECFALDRV